jgi:hypothetical protein
MAGGEFIGLNGKEEKKDYPTHVHPVESARDPVLAHRLLELSEHLTGVRIDLQ